MESKNNVSNYQINHTVLCKNTVSERFLLLIHISQDGYTPLHWATLNGHCEVVNTLVGFKAEIIHIKDNVRSSEASFCVY